MIKCIAKVRRWLAARPFQDNPEWASAPEEQTSSTWEDWVSRGRGIAGVEDCLLTLLESDQDPMTQSSAALALGYVGRDRSVNPLVRALKSQNSLVQMEAAAALGRLGNLEAVRPLCKSVKSPDANVRANICMALGQLGGEEAIACLRELLKDKDPFVQAAAREALRGNK
jgi:HEAT repeat protein